MISNTEESQMLNLINEYIQCSEYVFSILKKHFSIETDKILGSYRSKLIPKSGEVGNMYFNFHGGGCYFELENDMIDVDFGPNSRIDGFDLMRLEQFLNMRKNRHSNLDSSQKLADAFSQLVSNKIIINPKSFPNPHLYYLRERSNFAGNDVFL